MVKGAHAMRLPHRHLADIGVPIHCDGVEEPVEPTSLRRASLSEPKGIQAAARIISGRTDIAAACSGAACATPLLLMWTDQPVGSSMA